MTGCGRCNVVNVPEYAYKHKFWVARYVDHALWFWGAWDDEAEAHRVAKEIDGFVVENGGDNHAQAVHI